METTGDDPGQDRIVTVQYQALADDLTPAGAFQVMAEWEWGEKQVLAMVLEKGILEPKYYWFTKPYIDLAPILVFLNRGALAGSSLHNFADKESGARIPKMHRQGKYAEIIDYVTRERDAAVDLLRESREILGALGDGRRRVPKESEAKP